MNIVAILLVICSSVLLAYFFIRREIKHCSALCEAISIVEYISGRAMHFNEPLTDILVVDSFGEQKMLTKLRSTFFCELNEGLTVPEAWTSAVKKSFYDILYDYECDVLVHFGKNLCRCSSYEIENLRMKTVSDLEDFRNTAVENKKTKSKSTAAITVSAGVIIVLMFA